MSYGFSRGKVPTEQMTIVSYTPEREEPKLDKREEARAKGYTGNTCSSCFSSHMVIAGHCEVCTDCGTTTGCS